MTTVSPAYDVVVAGSGPGGAAAAAFLARGGLSVLVIDEQEFPRFRIGESLLPVGRSVLQDLGVEPNDEAFVYKRGAIFFAEKTDQYAFFGFSEAIDKSACHAWHVDRALFDQQLLNLAVQAGATARLGEKVVDCSFNDEGVSVQTTNGTFEARYFIDATGQGRFLAKKFGTVSPIKGLGKAAVYQHFDDIREEAWDDFQPAHDIRIVMVENGWMWVIPLPGRRLSIGLVSRERGIRPTWLNEAIESSPKLSRWTRGATTAGDSTIVSNFSYTNTRSYGPRFACVGDSACFIDPVFSSGVSLALQSAQRVSSLLIDAFKEQTEGNADLMLDHEATMQRAYDTFTAMIHRFYNTKFVENMIFGAPNDGEFRAGVTSILAGDVFRTDNAFQSMLLRSKRRGATPSSSHSAAHSPG